MNACVKMNVNEIDDLMKKLVMIFLCRIMTGIVKQLVVENMRSKNACKKCKESGSLVVLTSLLCRHKVVKRHEKLQAHSFVRICPA